MIILLHPRSTKPKNRRFPLAVLSLAAVLNGKEDYAIVDGNADAQPQLTLDRLGQRGDITLLAVSVMPGPQMVAAIPLCREFRLKYPSIPIVWGGYFASLYTDAALNARYVDFVVRGQGEETFLELIDALRTTRKYAGIKGLSYKDDFGLHVHNAERPLRSPNDFPWLPYDDLPNAPNYILPTFLGRRTVVHQASIGCPFRCTFCGVVPIYQGRQRTEDPERTAAVLGHLKRKYNVDSVQFYDNNFFLNESHSAALAKCLEPLNLKWWCEGRIDTVLRYSDETFRLLKKAGATMIFFGAESGSDWVLQQMNKKVTTDQTMKLAARIRQFGIVPEFSFVVGNPKDPERDTRETIKFIRRIKRANPDAEIIVQHYIPTPHPDGMYGEVEANIQFPRTPEEWATERWYNFTTRHDPNVAWLPQKIKRRIDNFDLVINSRWPTIQDIYLPRWGRAMLQCFSSWRYRLGVYAYPYELKWAQHFVSLRKPRLESI
ncbi:MAG TPA: radical SAM protein [Bryobacteraceae bacterium]|nr:radical SAM protein [Bryobacteraceae bacterium]